MFIKITTNKKGQSYYHLVESYRDQGKVRQRVLLSLGKVGEDRLDELVSAIGRHKDVLTAIEAAKSLDIKDTYILGPLLVLQHVFTQFGIATLLNNIVHQHPRLEFNFPRIIFTLIACRFIHPCSKLKVFEHWQDKLYPELLSGKDELHHFYRALDLLSQHKDGIERDLYWHQRDLCNLSVDVVLYDLTTLRFESTREDLDNLRRFGYSKENRGDCTQVVLGLLLDTEGIPLGFEVYPGNTFEGHTLASIVTRMREKFKIRRFIFVADRGLFSAANLKHIRKDCGTSAHEKGEFIVGMKLGVFKKRHNEFYDRSRFTSLNDQLEIYETTHGEDRCIITWSQARADRDRKTREDILAKIEKKLKSPKANGETFISNTNYRKYVTGLKKGTPQLNKEAISREALRDGFFGVITNVPTERMKASEIVAAYKHLWIIEDAFGEVKGTLKTRPIFHWTDERIIGHLTLCFLSYFCEAQITKLLRKQNMEYESPAVDEGSIAARPLTVSSAMQELKEVQAIPVNLRGKTAWVRTDIKGNAAKIFKAMGIAIPPKLLTPSSENQPVKNHPDVVAQIV
jgi:Transposase DDE domain